MIGVARVLTVIGVASVLTVMGVARVLTVIGVARVLTMIGVARALIKKSLGLRHQGNCHLAKSRMDSARTGC